MPNLRAIKTKYTDAGFCFFSVQSKSNARYYNTSVYLEARHSIFWELRCQNWLCALFKGEKWSGAYCCKAHLEVCSHFTALLQADSCAEIKVKQNKNFSTINMIVITFLCDWLQIKQVACKHGVNVS